MREEIIKMSVADFETSANEGQQEYFLLKDGHNVMSVKIDGKKVEFEVFLRLKDVPKKFGTMRIRLVERIRITK